jgi:outer membrane protein OmpA-like peptidoglycan-associated protein
MSSAKCHNYTGCLLAYRGEEIQLAAGSPLVCPECGKPVTPVSGGAAKVMKWVVMGVAATLLVAGAIFAAQYFTGKKPEPAGGTAVPPNRTGPVALPSTGASGTTKAPTNTTTTTQPKQASTSTGVSGNLDKPKVVENPDVSLENEQNRKVREDVLKRIDLMPNISPSNKDKLYNSVTRARGMGMVLQIPFGSGKTALSPNEVAALKNALDDAGIMRLRDDPTAVFVVLGYADSKGDDAKNIAVSQARADSVVSAMRDKAGVANVTHAVAMGGSTLHDPKNLDSNRVVEVWAVLP